MKSFMNEFKKFALRGNLLDMAVGVVVGGAFTSIANSLVADILMPLIGLFTGGIDFTSFSITLGLGENAAQITYGNFLQNVITFLITAFAVFLMVKAINKFQDAARRDKAAEAAKAAPKGPTTEQLLTEILAELKRR